MAFMVASVHRSGYLVLCGLLRPAEHELFASGGDRALGVDAPSAGSAWDAGVVLRRAVYTSAIVCA